MDDVHETMLNPVESDHPLAAMGVVAQTSCDVVANLNLHCRLAKVEVAVVMQVKAHRVLHDPVKPLPYRRPESTPIRGDSGGRGRRAGLTSCQMIGSPTAPASLASEQFRFCPWTYRLPRWQADSAVIPEGDSCPAWTAGVRGAARRHGGRVAAWGNRAGACAARRRSRRCATAVECSFAVSSVDRAGTRR